MSGVDADGAAMGSSLDLGASFTNAPGGTAHWVFTGGTNYNDESGYVSVVIGKASTTTVVTIAGGPFTYDGTAQTPATVAVTGAGGLSLSPDAEYANNVNAGTATASYNYAGDANHFGSSDSQDFAIGKASSTTVVTIAGGPFTYDGTAQTPATVAVTGAGGLSLRPDAEYANNVNAGTATASYSYAGDANHIGSSDSQDFTIGKASSTTVVTIIGGPFTYDGTAQTPATVTVTGAGGLSLSPDAEYTNNVNAGTATASYTYAGDANHFGSSDSQDFTIGKASSTTVVTLADGPFTYDGAAQTPATVAVTGAGGLSLSPDAEYANNVNAGTATASYDYAGDANHFGSSDSQEFTIGKASTTTVVTIAGGPFTYDGAAQTPATVTVTGAGGLSLSPDAEYTNNVNAGTATASYDYAGDANHFGSGDSRTSRSPRPRRRHGDGLQRDLRRGRARGERVGDRCGRRGAAAGSSLDLRRSFTDAPGGTAHWVFTGGTNYQDESGDVAIAIAKAAQTITWSNPAAINYGTPLSATQLNATVVGVTGGSAPGALTYTPPSGTVLLAGTQTLWVSAAETTNYHAATKSVSLVVNPYVASGFLDPIRPNRAFKQGSTVPIKWQLRDASGNLVTSLAAITSLQVTGPNGTTTLYPGNNSSSGATVLRNDGGQYIYNWQTKGFALGRYTIAATFADGRRNRPNDHAGHQWRRCQPGDRRCYGHHGRRCLAGGRSDAVRGQREWGLLRGRVGPHSGGRGRDRGAGITLWCERPAGGCLGRLGCKHRAAQRHHQCAGRPGGRDPGRNDRGRRDHHHPGLELVRGDRGRRNRLRPVRFPHGHYPRNRPRPRPGAQQRQRIGHVLGPGSRNHTAGHGRRGSQHRGRGGRPSELAPRRSGLQATSGRPKRYQEPFP